MTISRVTISHATRWNNLPQPLCVCVVSSCSMFIPKEIRNTYLSILNPIGKHNLSNIFDRFVVALQRNSFWCLLFEFFQRFCVLVWCEVNVMKQSLWFYHQGRQRFRWLGYLCLFNHFSLIVHVEKFYLLLVFFLFQCGQDFLSLLVFNVYI